MSRSSAPSTESHTSVLTERPGHERLSPAEHDLYLIWLVVGVIVITGTTLWLIFGDGLRKKLAPAPEPVPVRDQEWAHYPQPKDKP